MIYLGQPATRVIEAAARAALNARFSYPEVGASRDAPTAPPHKHFDVDHNRQLLGQGAECFARAKIAVDAWAVFPPGWTRVVPESTSQAVGTTVAVLIDLPFGIRTLSFARVVYRLEDVQEAHGVTRYGFAYGTLTTHVEIGEERFSVEWNRETDEVFYDLYAFSRPGHPLAKMAKPFARLMQARFRADSKASMVRAANLGESLPGSI